jgi:prepilin signal peptidase PulO-like enzyme (type II secretory pathway)
MEIFLVAILALIFGSFASCISYRLATKEPMVFTRSKCPKCNIALKIYNLIPLFSWIFQCGKCSNCQGQISLRYPLIEASFMIAFIAIHFACGAEINQKTILIYLIVGTLITISVIDIEQYFIPDSCQYFLAILAILLSITDYGTYGAIGNLKSAFLYMGFGLFLHIFFYAMTKIEAIGIDDIKFLFIAGLMLGVTKFLIFIFTTGLCGVIFGGLWIKFKKDETFPFAPALCFGTITALLLDPYFITNYSIRTILFLPNF